MSTTQKVLLVDSICQQIKDKILKGLYPPGLRLIEAELTAEFGVSRVTIRDSLRRLAAEGLVVLTPNKGIKVRLITKKEFYDVQVVRAQLEGLAAKLAAENTNQDLTALIQIHRQEYALLIKPEWDFQDGILKTELNHTFHDLIASISGNDTLPITLKQLWARVYNFEYQFLRSAPKSLFVSSYASHEDILNAIRAHRGDEAFCAAKDHVLSGQVFADYYFLEQQAIAEPG